MDPFTNEVLGMLFLLLSAAGTFLMFRLWGYPFDHEMLKNPAPRGLMRLHYVICYAGSRAAGARAGGLVSDKDGCWSLMAAKRYACEYTSSCVDYAKLHTVILINDGKSCSPRVDFLERTSSPVPMRSFTVNQS